MFHVTYAADWARLVKNEITCWRDFHAKWLSIAQTHPVYFFRFEDLTSDPEAVLREVFCFMLDIDGE